jgi:hypothetical protein
MRQNQVGCSQCSVYVGLHNTPQTGHPHANPMPAANPMPGATPIPGPTPMPRPAPIPGTEQAEQADNHRTGARSMHMILRNVRMLHTKRRAAQAVTRASGTTSTGTTANSSRPRRQSPSHHVPRSHLRVSLEQNPVALESAMWRSNMVCPPFAPCIEGCQQRALVCLYCWQRMQSGRLQSEPTCTAHNHESNLSCIQCPQVHAASGVT